MTTKHLTIGSTRPAPAGKVRVYSMRFCPFAQRVHLVLNAKNIPYDVVWINLAEKPEWYFSINAGGKVPVVETETGDHVCESLITSEFVDEKYPSSQLTSKDALRRAEDRLLIEYFNKLFSVYFKVVLLLEETEKDVKEGLEEFQNQLEKRNTKFLHGDTPGFVDYMIWPWFERFPGIPGHGPAEFQIDTKKYSKLINWTKDMKQVPAVQKHLLPFKIHDKFIRARANGQSIFDGIIEESS